MPKFFMNAVKRTMRRGMAKHDARCEQGKSLPDGVVASTDIPYAEGGGKAHLLDVYVPAGRVRLPLLLDIHGGALFYGYKELNKRFCYALAKLGFAVVSVNYRLVPDATFPDQLRDVTAAMRWAAAHIAEYGGRADEAYLCGDSAGALLALYAAAICGNRDIAAAFGNEGAPLCPRGCFFVSGLYDMHMGGMVKMLRGYAFGERYKKQPWYGYTKPRTLLAAWTPPPMFLTTGRGDMLRRQTERFAAALTDCGIPFDLDDAPARRDVDGARHVYFHIYPVKNPEWEESRTLMKRAVKFMTLR